jgi:hypothetical protein
LFNMLSGRSPFKGHLAFLCVQTIVDRTTGLFKFYR